MKYKRYISLAVTLTMCFLLFSNAKVLGYSNATNRMKTFGILDTTGRESNLITRGDFTKAVVIVSGFGDDALASKGNTIFPDVQSGSELSGYINVAIDKGLMVGSSDCKYHPEAAINFAQICTVLVKALGYSSSELQGTWPKNYIAKAKQLGLTGGINLASNDGVTMIDTAAIFDRLLDTTIKKSNISDPDKTFAEASGLTNDSFQYAGIASPVYSNPEVVSGLNNYTTSIGSVDLSGSPTIIKDGKAITVNDIEDNDLLYQVTDTWNTKKYILDVDNKVSGKITAISPTKIQIDSKDYIYGQGMDYSRIMSSYDSLGVDDYVTLLLGYDGKVADFFNIGYQDNSNFAFLLNYSSDSSKYKVKLLMVDGNTREYYTYYSPSSLKGSIVNFTNIDSETVTLRSLSYSYSKAHVIDKASRKIDDDYVAHNVKIFNVVNGNTGNDSDSIVELVNWSNMPDGDIEAGRILYIGNGGTYNDVNVMTLNDMFKDKYVSGIVKSIKEITTRVQSVDGSGNTVNIDKVTGYNYTITVNGSDKSWTSSKKDYSKGSVLEVLLVDGAISSINSTKSIAGYGYQFDSIDVNRVKVDGTSYYLKDNVQIYFCDDSGNYVLKSISDIETDNNYQYISLYLDKPSYSGGKVDTIIVRQ